MNLHHLTFLGLLLIGLSGCSSLSYHDKEDYSSRNWPRDTSLFNYGYTDYRHHYGFDVFRGVGSFHDGHFY